MAADLRKESSSSSDSSYFCEKGVPRLASSWNRHHLESIGVYYDDKCSNLSDILSLLQKCAIGKRSTAHVGQWKLPEIGEKIIELTKRLLTFSFDTRENELCTLDELSVIIVEFESSVDDFTYQHKDGLLKDKLNDRVFQRWSTYASDFLSYLKIIIARLQLVSYSSDMTAREGCFTQLFMNFMNIFLLKAEIGEAFKGEITVMGRRVSGIPDVRFPSYTERHKTVEVVTVAEVKHRGCLHKEETFNVNHLSDAVIGQHGAELLIERKNSYFKPAVSGIICIGNELIFTYLELEEDQYIRLQDREIDKRKSSKILYTRPYNFLDFSDRNEILDLCFWLGYVQLNAYKAMEV